MCMYVCIVIGVVMYNVSKCNFGTHMKCDVRATAAVAALGTVGVMISCRRLRFTGSDRSS